MSSFSLPHLDDILGGPSLEKKKSLPNFLDLPKQEEMKYSEIPLTQISFLKMEPGMSNLLLAIIQRIWGIASC